MSNKSKRTTFIIILSILVIIPIVVLFGWGFYNGYTDARGKSDTILSALEKNCDCKAIEQSVYLSGIQFGKDGVSKERGEYQLIDCNFESLDQEKERILEVLKKEVNRFDELDHLELEFINKDETQTVIIKNGNIQQ